MPGHPVHPVQPAQSPAQPTQSVHMPPPPLHSSVQAARRPHEDPAGDVVRWAAFSCLLVPVVLVVYGTSFGGAAVATLGLAAVTAACRVLLRHSEQAERNAARVPSEDRLTPVHRGRHSRAGTGSQRGCQVSGGMSPHD
ncbi:hypothetical protein ABT024_05640 [Streptomyces sp. NPDC002812]|uniref:hypothetical protein n=1 Tax=unclassified Streptomyces TaxID=2593676 RepID=UPI00332C4C66